MNTLDRLDKTEIRELLNKCWMTHDAMWFQNCLQEIGIEKTNKINRAACKSIGLIEAKRIKKSLGYEDIQTFEDIKEFTINIFEIVRGDFMRINPSFPLENVIHWEWENERCFSYEGIKQIGVIDQFQCGVFERIGSWFDSMGIKYIVTPEVEGCMMLTDGKCYRDYRFYL